MSSDPVVRAVRRGTLELAARFRVVLTMRVATFLVPLGFMLHMPGRAKGNRTL